MLFIEYRAWEPCLFCENMLVLFGGLGSFRSVLLRAFLDIHSFIANHLLFVESGELQWNL